MAWLGDGLADYAQRSRGLPSACSAIDLCRGSPHRGVSEGGALGNRVLLVSQPEDMAVGIAGIVYGCRRALVIFKVELDRPHLVLIQMRSMSFPVSKRHGFCQHPTARSYRGECAWR